MVSFRHMSGAQIALIGGTGVGDALLGMAESFHTLPGTNLEAGLFHHADVPILCLNRHAKGHRIAPSQIDYKGIALGLQQLGIQHCLASAAVGSLQLDWPIGSLAIASDFIDFSGRNLSLFDGPVHTDFTHPIPLDHALVAAADQIAINAYSPCVYACTNGPRYETPAEIRAFAVLGANVVGMTGATEAILFNEAGIQYGLVCVTTNLAAGFVTSPNELSSTLDHTEVESVMKSSGEQVIKLMLTTATTLANLT